MRSRTAAIAILSGTLLISACATTGEVISPEQTPIVVLRDVCLPYVFDGATEEVVLSRLGGRWMASPPDPFSPQPGPILRRGSPWSDKDTLILYRAQGPVHSPQGYRATRGCSLNMRIAFASTVEPAVRAEMRRRPAFIEQPRRDRWTALFCEPRPDGVHRFVGALRHPDGRAGFVVGGNARSTVVCP